MKIIKCALFCIMASGSSHISANIINNGDFDGCNFNNWDRYVDVTIQTSDTDDFTQVQESGSSSCFASINVDYSSLNSGLYTNEVAKNTLSTDIDLTAGGILSFDLATLSEFSTTVPGQLPANLISDSYFIALRNSSGGYYNENGNFGQLVTSQDITSNTGFSSFSFELSNNFDTNVNWSLDFVVTKGEQNGAESDNFGSSLLVDNVSLIPVNEPGTLLMFVAALGLILRTRFK